MQSALEALRMAQAQRELYWANRSNEVNGDLIDQSVLEDLDLLLRLGYGRAELAAANG